MKRGQLALFVIAALAVVFIFLFMFYLRSSVSETRSITATKKSVTSTYEVTPVKNYVTDCIKSTIETALFERMGNQSGYLSFEASPEYNEPGVSEVGQLYRTPGYTVPFYLLNDNNISLPLHAIETRLATYTAVAVEQCLQFDVFTQFNVSGPDVDYQKLNFNFADGPTDFNGSINTDDVVMKVVYPLTIERDDFSTSIDTFTAKVNIHGGALYDTVQNILQNLTHYDADEVYDLSTYCEDIIPDGCPSDKISHIYVVDETATLPKNYTIAVNNSNAPYSKEFSFWFAVSNENIIGSCSC